MSPNESNKRHDHERTDWNLRWVAGSGLALVISVAVMLLASWWIFKEFYSSAAGRELGTVIPPPVAPPEPRLQVSPNADWDAMLEKERATLHSYGWVDRSKGIVRIPIDRQMQFIAERGFPARAAQARGTK